MGDWRFVSAISSFDRTCIVKVALPQEGVKSGGAEGAVPTSRQTRHAAAQMVKRSSSHREDGEREKQESLSVTPNNKIRGSYSMWQ